MNSNKFDRLIFGIAILIAIVGLFSAIMTSFNHDENMYITAGFLIKENKILYRDFTFIQMPYLPLLYGIFYKLTNASYYLLIGKFFCFLFFSVSALIVFLISHRLSKNLFISTGIFILYILNRRIIGASIEATNYIMPVAFSFLGFYLYIISVTENKIRPRGVLFSGLCIAIAIGTKAFYATTVLPFVIASLIFPLSVDIKKRVLTILIPFISGILIGLLPVFYYLLSDYAVFIFNIIGYWPLHNQWYGPHLGEEGISLYSKTRIAYWEFFKPDNALLILGILIYLFSLVDHFRSIKETIKSLPMVFFIALFLFIISVPTVILPVPLGGPHHLTAPVSFLFLLFTCSCSLISGLNPQFKNTLISFILLTLLSNGPFFLQSSYYLVNKDNWAGFKVHNIAINIRNQLGEIKNQQKVATLSPLYAIEANLPIYDELAIGPFLYRVGDLLTSEQRTKVVWTSPQSIHTLFDKDPPVAILVGFEGYLDNPLREYAKVNNYTKADGDFGGGELYLRSP